MDFDVVWKWWYSERGLVRELSGDQIQGYVGRIKIVFMTTVVASDQLLAVRQLHLFGGTVRVALLGGT